MGVIFFKILFLVKKSRIYYLTREPSATPIKMSEESSKTKGIGTALKSSFDSVDRTNYVLAIGINNYKNFENLNNCIKDIEDVNQVLTDRFLFETANITTLFDEKATKNGIYREFRRLCQEFKKKEKDRADNLVIYFSGHGFWDEDFPTRGYWVPQEAGNGCYPDYIPNSDVRDFLEDINAHHIFLISDSCFSGTFFLDGLNRSASQYNDKHRSRWGLAAGRLEVPDGTSGANSPFALALLQVLTKSQDSVSVSEICASVMDKLKVNNQYNGPIGEPLVIRGHDNGQFYFHLDVDEDKEWQMAEQRNDFQAYLQFSTKFPDSKKRKTAQEKLLELEESLFWKEISGKVIDQISNYLDLLPIGKYAEIANELLDDREDELAWLAAEEQHTVHGYKTYLQHKRRTGQLNQEATARSRIKALTPPPVAADAMPTASLEPAVTEKGRYMWCIDNGHGKDTAGKRSPVFDLDGVPFQLFEYELNRDVVNRIRRILAQKEISYFVVTEEKDDVSLAERVSRVNFLETDKSKIFLSVHSNFGPTEWTKAEGIETWYCEGSKTGKKIANVFQQKLVAATEWYDRRTKPGRFYTLRKTTCPAVHTESGFMNNPEQCKELLKDEVRQKIAEAHVAAILEIEEQGIGNLSSGSVTI